MAQDDAVSADAGVTDTKYKFTSDAVNMKDSKVTFEISTKDGVKLSNKTVQVTFKDRTSNMTTDSKGQVSYKLYAKGTHTISFLFNDEGYKPINFTKKLMIVDTSKTTVKASNYVAYQGVKNPYKVALKAGTVKLANKKVTFKIAGKTYIRKTDANGEATLNINLKKGTYKIKVSFAGEKNLKASSVTKKVVVHKMSPTRITWQNAVIFKEKTSTPFIIKYRDVRENPISHATIIFKINKKTYKVRTDKEGKAHINLKLKAGSHILKVSSYNSEIHKKSENTYAINVRSLGVNHNGFWLFGADMKKVNLSQMAKSHVKEIFLNYYAVELHGKSEVSSFALQAKNLGIRVHIWIQVFNNGKWLTPIKKDGSIDYSLIKSRISIAKEYAKIKGVAGIHFDYLRFPGTAYKYKNGVKAINYFTKEASNAVHKINPSLIVSAAVMPEPSAMKYYYGQDIATMSKYLDVIVPMVYKGNYNAGTSWIKSVTASMAKMSSGAQIWAGLQSYKSNGNYNKLSASTLVNDGYYAAVGGASGIILFRYGYFDMFDFNRFKD